MKPHRIKLWPHHERAVTKIIPVLDNDPEALCMILGGSLAKGWGSETSDLDGHMVVSDEALAERTARDDLVYPVHRELCEWENGYFDLKYVSLSMLRDGAERGSEPFRASFWGAQVRWSRLDEPIEPLIEKIVAYPEAGHADKVKDLACHLEGTKWFALEAAKRDDAYLMLWSAQRAVLLASRLVLAHNRVLFPFHKWLMRCVDEAAEKPEGFRGAVDTAIADPNPETIGRVCDLGLHFQDWGKPEEWWNPFITRTEWAWRYGPAPIDDA